MCLLSLDFFQDQLFIRYSVVSPNATKDFARHLYIYNRGGET